MATLTTKARKKIPKKEFGLPSERKYPINDRGHAIAAKSRATQMVKAGKLTKAQEKKIDAKANKMLDKKKPAAKKAASKKPTKKK